MPHEKGISYKKDNLHKEKDVLLSAALLEIAGLETESVLKRLESQPQGLSEAEAGSRLEK